MRTLVLALAFGMLGFAFLPIASAAIPVTCTQFVAFSGFDARCTIDGAPVYAGANCGTLCTGTEIIECQETNSPRLMASCELPYVFCPYGPICPGPYL